MAAAGMDRAQRFEYLDATTAADAARAQPAAVLGGCLVDSALPAGRGSAPLAPEARLAKLVAALPQALQGPVQRDGRVRVRLAFRPAAADLHVEGGELQLVHAFASGEAVVVLQEQERFGAGLGTWKRAGAFRAPDQEAKRLCRGGPSFCVSYGATGSGKTTFQRQLAREVGAELLASGPGPVELQAVELLKGPVADLLGGAALALPEVSLEQVQQRAQVRACATPEELEQHLEEAHQSRATRGTATSERSSRSHALFLLRTARASVCLVDLAGSERSRHQQSHDKEQRDEAKEINWSLSCLHECVRALAARKPPPLRRHALARLLEQALTAEADGCLWVAHVHACGAELASTLHTCKNAQELVAAGEAAGRAPPERWTKAQLQAWLKKLDPTAAPGFLWADGKQLALEWPQDAVARAAACGVAPEAATKAVEAFHALRRAKKPQAKAQARAEARADGLRAEAVPDAPAECALPAELPAESAADLAASPSVALAADGATAVEPA